MQEVRYWYADEETRRRQDEANARARQLAETELNEERKAAAMKAGAAPALRIARGDGNLGVYGKDFSVLFSYQEGGPVSLRYKGVEWMFRAPRPALWRAPTENDIGCRFPQKSAVWRAADQYLRCSGWEILHAEADAATIRYRFTLPAVPQATAEVCYTVNRLGEIQVRAAFHGVAGLPELPCFGSCPVSVCAFPPRPRWTEWIGWASAARPILTGAKAECSGFTARFRPRRHTWCRRSMAVIGALYEQCCTGRTPVWLKRVGWN